MDDMRTHRHRASECGPDRIPAADIREATGAFVRAHAGWMLRLARRYLADEALAEDAVQNAFIKVFGNAGQLAQRSGLRGWMRRIVINESLMILRKTRARNEDEAIDPLLPEFDRYDCRIEPPWRHVPSPEQIVITNETREIVLAAIARLPPTYRAVLLLRDIEEFSTGETAEALGISAANAKVRLHRARAALKALLEPEMRKRRFAP